MNVFFSSRDSNAKNKWKYGELLLHTSIRQVYIDRFVQRLANRDRL